MISFKRTKKRSYRNPLKRRLLFCVVGLFAVMLTLTLSAFASRSRMAAHLTETREIMAACIQSDMSKALSCFETIDRKSADLSGEVLPTLRLHMYSANSMNHLLTETFGEKYSVIDDEQYDVFQSIMDQFDQLLAAGQSTDPAKDELTACMTAFQKALVSRFSTEGNLLPKTASSR